jgi:hypothetical protein
MGIHLVQIFLRSDPDRHVLYQLGTFGTARKELKVLTRSAAAKTFLAKL